MIFLSKKPEGFLGVDIGAGGIKMVELHNTKGRPQLWTYGVVDEIMDVHLGGRTDSIGTKSGSASPPTAQYKQDAGLDTERIDKYAAVLKALLDKSRIKARVATAGLPVSHVFHAVITLPKVDSRELPHHVSAKVKKMLPRPIEEMEVVHQLIPSSDAEAKHLRVLVTAAPVDLIRFYTAIFQKAGLELEELETEAFALERSLVGRDKATVMVLDIGADRTNFFIMDQGIPLMHRSVQLGGSSFDTLIHDSLALDMDEPLIEQIKADIGRLPSADIPLGAFTSVIDPIIKEIQYSFDLFLNQTGNTEKRPEKIILTGGGAVFPPLIRAIQQALSVKVFVGDPWARVVYQQGLKPVLDTLGPRMAVAIGLALRNIV